MPRLALLLVIRAMMADSLPWGVQDIRQTGIRSSDVEVAVLSPNGDIYLAGRPEETALLSKVDGTGRGIFAIQIAGAYDANAIHLGPDGSVYLMGYAIPGKFVTTPGAYRSTAPGDLAPFLCKLSGTDGHILFCTYVDMPFSGSQGFTVDSGGHVYLASNYCDTSFAGCVEKFNPTGTGLVYEISLATGYVSSASADVSGNLYLIGLGGPSFFLTKLDATGTILATVYGNPNEFASVQLDPSGNPQILIGVAGNTETVRVRRYSADLSRVLFETPAGAFSPTEMMIGPNGETIVLGGTDAVNFTQYRPTAACDVPSSPEIADPTSPLFAHGVLVRLDATGQTVQSTFAGVTPELTNGFAQTGMASVLIYDYVSGKIVIVKLGPVQEVQLGCVGNSASFRIGPLAPEELISIFGQHLGPDAPVSAQPGLDNSYPFQLAGTQVTFDGVAAPVLYVSGSQINAVTPWRLSGLTTTQVCLLVNGMKTNCMDAPVQPANPAIFVSGAVTVGYPNDRPHAAALNQDGTINSQSNPAPAGSIVSIFATGLGAMTPIPPDGGLIGLPPPSQDLQVRVPVLLGLNQSANSLVYGLANVLYAGPAPNEVEGMSQINFQVPARGEAFYIEVSSGTFHATTATGVLIWATGQQ
ncbi:MAG: hypothetical protein LAQ69_14750 [Acidobacteriia bacterium]|nr:hypothetical protein [Terriglobia bacterium]